MRVRPALFVALGFLAAVSAVRSVRVGPWLVMLRVPGAALGCAACSLRPAFFETGRGRFASLAASETLAPTADTTSGRSLNKVGGC